MSIAAGLLAIGQSYRLINSFAGDFYAKQHLESQPPGSGSVAELSQLSCGEFGGIATDHAGT
jgi:hypothetical protein